MCLSGADACGHVCAWVMDLIWDSVRGDNRFQLLLFIHYQHSWMNPHPLCLHLCLSILFFSSIFCSTMCSRHSHGDHIPPQTPPVSKAGVSFCWLALYRNSCLLNNSPHTYVAVFPFRTVPSLPTCTAQKSQGIVLHLCKHVRGLWYFCTFQLVAIFSMFAALTFDRKGRTCYKKTRLNVSRLLAEPLASEHFNNCLN